MAAFLDLCRFTTTLGGLTDWTFSAAVGGCQSPAAAGAVNGRVYKFYAVSADLTQWELAEGAYNSSTGVFARTTVIFSSASNAKVNFTAAPQVSVVAVKEDLISVEEANSFTTTQQAQIRSNIGAAAAGTSWTSYTPTVTAGSGTFGTVSATGRYLVSDKTVFITVTINVTAVGTAGTSLNATLPAGITAAAASYALNGAEGNVSGKAVKGFILSGGTSIVSIDYYDNTFAGGSGSLLTLTGIFEKT